MRAKALPIHITSLPIGKEGSKVYSPREWPTTVTRVAAYAVIAVFTAAKTAVADLDVYSWKRRGWTSRQLCRTSFV